MAGRDSDAADGLGAANARYLAIVLGGSFDSDSNRTGQEPTALQVLALLSLLAHLFGEHRAQWLPPELFNAIPQLQIGRDVWAHSDFGKPACPGRPPPFRFPRPAGQSRTAPR